MPKIDSSDVPSASPEQQVADPELQISAECAEALGRFVVVWGSVEHTIESIITCMFHVAPVFRHCLTSGMTIDSKISMIRNGLGTGGGVIISPEDTKKYSSLLERLRKLVAEHRNFVFHWIVTPSRGGAELTAAKLKGGTAPKIVLRPMSKEYFEDATRLIAEVREQLREMRTEIAKPYARQRSAFIRTVSTAELRAELAQREITGTETRFIPPPTGET